MATTVVLAKADCRMDCRCGDCEATRAKETRRREEPRTWEEARRQYEDWYKEVGWMCY